MNEVTVNFNDQTIFVGLDVYERSWNAALFLNTSTCVIFISHLLHIRFISTFQHTIRVLLTHVLMRVESLVTRYNGRLLWLTRIKT